MDSDASRSGIATPDTRGDSPPQPSVPPIDPSLDRSPTPSPAKASAPGPVHAQPLPSGSPPYRSPYSSPAAPPFAPSSPFAPAPPFYSPAQPQRQHRGVHWGVWVLGGLLGILLLGTITAVVVAALIGGLTATAGQTERTDVTTKMLTVSGMPSLVVSDSAGNVSVQSGSENHVTVQVTRHAWAGSTSVAQRGLSAISVNLTQSGDMIKVAAQFPTNVFDGGMTRRTVDLLVTTPAQSNVDVNLGAGNIEARQLSGAIKLVSGAGNLTLSGDTFAQSSLLNIGAGNITGSCAIASGANVQMQIGAGNATLTMPVDTPAHLVASTGVGNMTITGWSMPMTGTGVGHHTSGDMNPRPTATLTIQIGTGNLTMMNP